MDNPEKMVPDKDAFSQIQLVLAEKRTALAILRTGIAVFVLPLSVFSFLIATSKFFDVSEVLHYFIPLVMITTGLIFLGAYLILRSFVKLHHYDDMIKKIKKSNCSIAEFVD